MPFLSDDRVSLRAVEPDDLPLLRDWRNDYDLRQRTREYRALNMLDQQRWLERVTGGETRDFMFVVEVDLGRYRPAMQEAVGVVGLCHHDRINRTAEVSFYIGDDQARGKGYASAALRLLIGWGFYSLDLERIWAESYAFNTPGINLLKKLGFVYEGILRSAVYRNGERHDSVILGLLKGEWND